MIGSLAQSDWLILVRLITAHLITEGLCQLPIWKPLKSSNKFILILCSWLIQGAVAGGITYLFAGPRSSALLIAIIFISRTAMNLLEYKYKKRETKAFFIAKHSVYLVVNTAYWIWLVGINLADINNSLSCMISNARLWTVGLAYIILIWPTGCFIGIATEFWRKQLQKSKLKGLANAGLWLGRLERILILTFVLLSKFEAIGFLITAKSIFRFSEIKSSGDRKEAEYILIGTMMSFVIALLFGIFTNWLLNQVTR